MMISSFGAAIVISEIAIIKPLQWHNVTLLIIGEGGKEKELPSSPYLVILVSDANCLLWELNLSWREFLFCVEIVIDVM